MSQSVSFPLANTVYVWSMSPDIFAIGVYKFVEDNTLCLEQFESIAEFSSLEEAVEQAGIRHEGMNVVIVTETGMLAAIDQHSAYLRNVLLESN